MSEPQPQYQDIKYGFVVPSRISEEIFAEPLMSRPVNAAQTIAGGQIKKGGGPFLDWAYSINSQVSEEGEPWLVSIDRSTLAFDPYLLLAMQEVASSFGKAGGFASVVIPGENGHMIYSRYRNKLKRIAVESLLKTLPEENRK